MNALSLFSGVGGLDRGMEAAGFGVVGLCERDHYARRVLARHWPDAPCADDVRAIGAEWAGRVDVVAGGFPCQPHSVAGKRGASDDDRDLWPEVRRVLGLVRPRFVLLENVPGLLTSEGGGFFRGILSDLMALGYAAEWDHCPAVAVGAPHRRDRVFIVATLDGAGGGWLSVPVGQVRKWPRAGWAAGGRMGEREALWPASAAPFCTPTKEDAGRGGDAEMAARWAAGERVPDCHQRLRTQALIPTPRSEDSESSGVRWSRGVADTLTAFTRIWPAPAGESRWPTPRASDWRSGKVSDDTLDSNARPLNEIAWVAEGKPAEGSLNPTWVEWLMGWPLGWTLPEGPSLRGVDPHPWTSEPCARLTTEREHRRDRLRCCGNGVVSLVAETVARRFLVERARGAA